MTVLTKSTVPSKPDVISAPLMVNNEHKVRVGYSSHEQQRIQAMKKDLRIVTRWICVCSLIIAVVVVTALCGLLYHEMQRSRVSRVTFQGFCSLPVDVDDSESPEEPMRLTPVTWSVEPMGAGAGADADEFDGLLRERLEVEGDVERVEVLGAPGGRRAAFVHDWGRNVTGVVTPTRCFVSALAADVALPPAALARALAAGERLDVSRRRRALRALLPPLSALAALSALASHCADRPMYELVAPAGDRVKRSAEDAPAPDFVHFSGNHVHEIAVQNMADVLRYERRARARR